MALVAVKRDRTEPKLESGRKYRLVEADSVEGRELQLYSGPSVDGKTIYKDGKVAKGGEYENNPTPGLLPGGRNPSGTFSTPTPTDIRFPDKKMTEFENNAGAFIGKSAAGIRAELGLPDAPGGVYPVDAMRVEATGSGFFRIVVGDGEGENDKEIIVDALSKGEKVAFEAMDNDEKLNFVMQNRQGAGTSVAQAAAGTNTLGVQSSNKVDAGKTDASKTSKK